MTTTWASSSHIRHPWFDTVMMKRKYRDTVSPDEEQTGSSLGGSSSTVNPIPNIPPPSKRRRCSVLENGFAHLSLNSESTPQNAPNFTRYESGPIPSRSYYYTEPTSPDMASSASQDSSLNIQDVSAGVMDAEPSYAPSCSFIQNPTAAYTVEEPQIPEVDMKQSSWYEPERDRIVVTDIDSFAQSDDEGEENASGHHINPALLSRIRETAARSSHPRMSSPNPSNSQALVLFKPLPIVGEDLERITEKRSMQQREAELATAEKFNYQDDDAMDVEP